MNLIMKYSLAGLLLFSSVMAEDASHPQLGKPCDLSGKQDSKGIPLDWKDWKESTLPQPRQITDPWNDNEDSAAQEKANQPQWEVYKDNGKIMVREYSPPDAIRYDLPNGYILGIKKEPWDGFILFHDNNTGKEYKIELSSYSKTEMASGQTRAITVNHEKSAPCNPIGFFAFPSDVQYADSVYLVEGLNHTSWNYGNIYRLVKNNETWEAFHVMTINTCPGPLITNGHDIYMPTQEGIEQLNNSPFLEPKKRIAAHCDFNGETPTSIIKSPRGFLIGLRGGILMWNPATREFKWYVKKPN